MDLWARGHAKKGPGVAEVRSVESAFFAGAGGALAQAAGCQLRGADGEKVSSLLLRRWPGTYCKLARLASLSEPEGDFDRGGSG